MTATPRKTAVKALETVDDEQVTNDAADSILVTAPVVVTFTLEGVCPLLFHRWSTEAVEAKAAAAKNSVEKKTDNIESYVYRNEQGELCIPGEYVRMSMVGAARYTQDPRSPRKSGMDLYKAGIVSLTELASVGVSDWDYLDARRVMVQRSGVTRRRPALNAGWRAEFTFLVNTPEYISPLTFHQTLANAGRLIGLADFRPSYGRFIVKSFSQD